MTQSAPDSNLPHVWLIAGYEPDDLRSMERYLQLVSDALHSLNMPFTVCRPFPWLGRGWIPGRLRRLLGFVDKYLIFPLLLRIRISCSAGISDPLIHLLDQGNALLLPALAPFQTIVTCHDFIAMRSALGMGPHPKASAVQRLMLNFLRHATAWICVSHETKRHAMSLLAAPDERCVVVHNPLAPEFTLPGVETAKFSRPYLLHVGNSAWYKNRTGLLRIYHALLTGMACPPRLLLLGQPLSETENLLLQELHLEDHVDLCIHPSDQQVANAYAHAEALVFPSLEEGFGWPPLEAMAAGCPVFTSNLAPLTEIGGDGAEYFDPGDPDRAAALIANRLALGEPWRQERARLGRERASFFSTRRFASQLGEAYCIATQRSHPALKNCR